MYSQGEEIYYLGQFNQTDASNNYYLGSTRDLSNQVVFMDTSFNSYTSENITSLRESLLLHVLPDGRILVADSTRLTAFIGSSQTTPWDTIELTKNNFEHVVESYQMIQNTKTTINF